jgi:hypothetical protein
VKPKLVLPAAAIWPLKLAAVIVACDPEVDKVPLQELEMVSPLASGQLTVQLLVAEVPVLVTVT